VEGGVPVLGAYVEYYETGFNCFCLMKTQTAELALIVPECRSVQVAQDADNEQPNNQGYALQNQYPAMKAKGWKEAHHNHIGC
jgi:hypothetical protein